MPRRLLAILSLLAITTAFVCPEASVADEAACNADKLGSLSRAATSLLRCRARTVGHADPLDPDCAAEVDSLLANAFAAAEAGGGCASSGELSDVTTALHAFEGDLMTLLVVPPDGRRCAAGKLRATARRAKHELNCRRVAAAAGMAVDPLCVASSETDLSERFGRRDARGTCTTTGDAAAANGLVADFLFFAASRIDGSSTTPVPTGLMAAVSGASIDLTWVAPDPGSGLVRSRLLRVLNAAPGGPDDPAAAVVFEGEAEAAGDDLTALLPNTTGVPRTYHYAVYGCDIDSNCETTGSHTTITPTVREALRAGGYVLHWRHASADVCGDQLALGTADTTAVPDWWKSCDSNCGTATARQLNTTGRTEAAAIGDAFATLGITVGRVLTSEFCRNVETASLMDFGPVLEESQELTYFVYDEASRCSDTFAMLGGAPAPGTNTALIGHAGNSCAPLSSLAWAEAAIYKPDGMGGATYVDRVTAGAWLSLP